MQICRKTAYMYKEHRKRQHQIKINILLIFLSVPYLHPYSPPLGSLSVTHLLEPVFSANCRISSTHMRCSLSLLRFVSRGRHCCNLFVHLLAVCLGMCPAHCHFNLEIHSTTTSTLEFDLITSFRTLLRNEILNIFFL